MKKIAMLLCCFSVCFFSNTAFANDFTDMVPENHWAYEALQYAQNNEIIQGFDDNTIRPNTPLTRAQMAAIVVREYGDGSNADITQYSDISEDSWYYNYFKEAVGMKLFQGDGTGLMYPDANITRQEAFVVMARLLKVDAISGNTSFVDDDQIATWAKGMIKGLYENNYISGDSAQCVHPKNEITRAEFAQLIYNISQRNAVSTENQQKPNSSSGSNQTSGDKNIETVPDSKPTQIPSLEDESKIGFYDGDSYLDDIFDD